MSKATGSCTSGNGWSYERGTSLLCVVDMIFRRILQNMIKDCVGMVQLASGSVSLGVVEDVWISYLQWVSCARNT